MTRRARTRRLGMARSAHGAGGSRRHVGAMAIEAALGARVLAVLGGALHVAARAVGRNDRRRFVDAVTLGAVDGRVLRDGCRLAVGLRVAAGARGGRPIRSEGVTGRAPGGVAPCTSAVRDVRLFGVAGLAHAGPRVLETVALEIMTRGASDVEAAYVLLVPGACAVLGPRRGDEAGGYARWRVRPPSNDDGHGRGEHDRRGQDRPACATLAPRHGPTPWQSRQGKS